MGSARGSKVCLNRVRRDPKTVRTYIYIYIYIYTYMIYIYIHVHRVYIYIYICTVYGYMVYGSCWRSARGYNVSFAGLSFLRCPEGAYPQRSLGNPIMSET